MRVVFQQFVIDQHALAAEEDTVGKDKGRSTLGLAVDCFGAAVQVIHEHYPDKMLDFLNTVIAPPSEGDGGRPGDRHSMAHHLKVLQQLVGQLITAKAQYTKEAATVLGVIKVVLSHVTVDRSGHATRVKKWLIKLCEEQKHDPRLMPIVCWWLVIRSGVSAYPHLRDTSWSFWKPTGWFLYVLALAIEVTIRERRLVNKQRQSCSKK